MPVNADVLDLRTVSGNSESASVRWFAITHGDMYGYPFIYY